MHAGRAADSTVEALIWSLRTYGMAAFYRPGNRQRFAELSPDQIKDVLKRLIALRDQYPAVTDAVLLHVRGVR